MKANLKNTPSAKPPKWIDQLLDWFCAPELLEEVLGDLHERHALRVARIGESQARWQYVRDSLSYLRLSVLKRKKTHSTSPSFLQSSMVRNYFTIAFRHMIRNKAYSLINIGGLAVGMAVAMLIGLWVWDELSFDHYHKNNQRIAAVMQTQTYEGEVETWSSQSMQLGPELRNTYGSYFKRVVMSSFTENPILAVGEKALTKTGYYMEAAAPELLSLRMLKGTRSGLADINSILLSESTAFALFGDKDPVGKVLQIDNQYTVKVTGVYEDLPNNSSFNDLGFLAPLDLLVKSGNRNLGWVNNWLMVLVELAENTNLATASAAIKNAKLNKVDQSMAKFKPQLLLHPLSDWHLYSEFENGVNTGGHIEFVWLFGIIGVFVMLLACINFMNLSTARSATRAKEVGIRKVVGSVRSQLIGQFFSESLLFVFLAFALSLLLVQFTLPLFNEVANKKINIPWTHYGLWLFGSGIVLITALFSGSYPALYLSAFRPGKVLKGTFRVGRYAAVPRKALVVIQFTVSVTLIIGTIIVYKQIQFAKNRPIGYDRNGLLTIPLKTGEVKKHFEALRHDLLATGAIEEVSMSECAVTDMWWSDDGFEWQGKDPNMQDILYRGAVNHEFGKTVGWKIKQGRDFSRDFSSDSTAMILNEAAVVYMGLKNPVGQTIKAYGKNYTVIGVVANMITQSLYRPVQQTFFIIDPFNASKFVNIRISARASAGNALEAIEQAFSKHNPAVPFEYKFVDEQFADKFAYEAQIGKLAGFFAVLAIFISCLGLFVMASFAAEQRTREIGIRKVLGASVFHLWQLLSKDFFWLVLLSILIATPVAYYLADNWLQKYEYRTPVSWWIFALAGLAALVITLLTVSYQSLKAALSNPVKSLRDQ